MALIRKNNINLSRQVHLKKLTERSGLRNSIYITDACIYKGGWENDEKNGMGRMVTTISRSDNPKKELYEGSWHRNKKHGWGKLSHWNKSVENFILFYNGEWVNNAKHGFGYLHYSDGRYYEGNLNNNMKHGYGRCFYPDGAFYEGQWALNKFNGHGIFVEANGNRYEGCWKAGVKCGWGTYFHFQKGQIQEGFWHHGVPVRSTLSDLPFRESHALHPNPFPIPKCSVDPDTPWLKELYDKKNKTEPKAMLGFFSVKSMI